MRKKKRVAGLAGLCAAALLLSACAFHESNDTLYRLPKLPAEYESLETQIDALLASGAEYAAPTSGSNLQSVQMVDLDGDGEEEAVAILRRPGDEKPMKVYVFRADGDNYGQYCLIEGASNAVYSINYVDLNGDGSREILAGTRSSSDVQNLAVYSVADGEVKPLLTTGYSRYTALDMDGDGRLDLIVLRSDEESVAVADYYAWNGTELELYSSLRLSSSVAELSRLTAGTLEGGESALFVTGVTESSDAITDILTMRDSKLQVVRHGGELVHFLGLYPNDIDGDGVTEVPEPVPFPQLDPEGLIYYRICWRQYDAEGGATIVRESYRDTLSGWSLTLPEEWRDGVMVTRTGTTDISAVSFSRYGGEELQLPFLTVYTFTGDMRDAQVLRAGYKLLIRRPDTIYAFELTEAAEGLIDETAVRERFSLITPEWTTGEN